MTWIYRSFLLQKCKKKHEPIRQHDAPCALKKFEHHNNVHICNFCQMSETLSDIFQSDTFFQEIKTCCKYEILSVSRAYNNDFLKLKMSFSGETLAWAVNFQQNLQSEGFIDSLELRTFTNLTFLLHSEGKFCFSLI